MVVKKKKIKKIKPEKLLYYLKNQRDVKKYLEENVFKKKSSKFEENLSCLIFLENLLSYELISLIKLRKLFINITWPTEEKDESIAKIQKRIKFEVPSIIEKKTLGTLVDFFNLYFENSNFKKDLGEFVQLRNNFTHHLLDFPPRYSLKIMKPELEKAIECGKRSYQNLKKIDDEIMKGIECKIRRILDKS